jgi:prepilin-type N-terminal cleavage/methylation domain-containing protein
MSTPLRLSRRQRGFSLVELVIVVVIIGIIAAIAIPRFAGASQGASEAALRADLRTLRGAIERYAPEHNGEWPAYRPAGPDALHASYEAFERQLTQFTDSNGAADPARDASHPLGPYLSKIPPLPVGSRAGSHKVASINYLGTPGAAGDEFGWEYSHYTGEIRVNLPNTEIGSDNVPYSDW